MSSKSMKYGASLFHKILPEGQSPWSRMYGTPAKRGVMASQSCVTIVSNKDACSHGCRQHGCQFGGKTMSERLVIVDGIRTPFCKMGTDLALMGPDELGRI